MKCGKTQRLIEEYKKHSYLDKSIMMFKPTIDDRFASDAVCDRNDGRIDCINICGLNDLFFYVDKVDIFFIDEFQFLGGSMEPILQLVDLGKRFFIAGLNLTAERNPFGQMNNLLCCADNVINLTGICDRCKKEESIFTFCKLNKTEDILIGDAEYLSVCPKCYKELTEKETL